MIGQNIALYDWTNGVIMISVFAIVVVILITTEDDDYNIIWNRIQSNVP